jgi:hypothetical protein
MSASYKSRFYRQLLDGSFHSGTRKGLTDTSQFEHDPSRLYHRDPKLGVALARAHAGLGWLGRDRLIGEHTDPDFAATANVTGHCDTSCLNLAGTYPTRLEGLDPEVAKTDLGATFSEPAHAATLLFAVLYLARHQHGC